MASVVAEFVVVLEGLDRPAAARPAAGPALDASASDSTATQRVDGRGPHPRGTAPPDRQVRVTLGRRRE